ncbi:MAG: hypothetical protein DWQ02_20565 [Bacteroidetes bacterium]|nr:MAG: hypothetical protein DWQ02_20565 [Bacteroidota bacterium]
MRNTGEKTRRNGFKIQFWQQSAGSIPAFGTTQTQYIFLYWVFFFTQNPMKKRKRYLMVS